MNNIVKKVLSSAEEFANGSNRLGLVADSILDRILPKATAHAAYREYRWVSGGASGDPNARRNCLDSGRLWQRQEYRDCSYQGSNLCGPWTATGLYRCK
jgi:hypothetical protein